MNPPKVSIIVPVYNAGTFLAEGLDSILAQDFQDVEILIADDRSTDDSLEIIKKYAARDPRIRWWQNPRNLGLTQNHNAGLREARGEFIKFVHQDDKLLQPSVLTRMTEILESDPTISLVASGSHLMDKQSVLRGVRNNFRQTGVRDGKSVIMKCLEENQNLIGEPTVVMFRKCQAARGFDERYRQILDMEFWFHLLEQGRFAYLAEPLFAYRLHPQQATETNRLNGAGTDEHLMIFNDYFRKPWLKEHASRHAARRMLFKQIYYLRKKYGARVAATTAEALANLKPLWYAVYWLEHKCINPFVKLQKRGLRKPPKS